MSVTAGDVVRLVPTIHFQARDPVSASSTYIEPRIHVDLYSDDREAEVQRLTGLGATEIPWDNRPPDADYVVMADPEGNRFCVIDAGP